jgi:hypothetical protein
MKKMDGLPEILKKSGGKIFWKLFLERETVYSHLSQP